MSDAVVLDASALLCLLNGEFGADLVAESLPRSIVSAVNLAEVVGKLADLGGPQDKIELALRALHLKVVPFDQAQAVAVGALRPLTKTHGLSLGDRACLALAKQVAGVAMTADRAWAGVAGLVEARVAVIR